MMYAPVKLFVDFSVRGLCYEPYPNHPKGCPNWRRRATCPPQAPLINEVLDLTKMTYVIWSVFPLGRHVDSMRSRHPDWTDRQLRNCLYWQGTARKQLRLYIADLVKSLPHLRVITCPEACGVHVTETMKEVGVWLEWPPVNKAYQVAVAGTPTSEPGKAHETGQ